jgi:hypothetical protein
VTPFNIHDLTPCVLLDCRFLGEVLIRGYEGMRPTPGAGMFVDPSAQVIGGAEVGESEAAQ